MALPLIPAPHLATAETTAIKTKLQEAFALISPKAVTLTPGERKAYGRIKEKNKLKVNKVRDLRLSQPALSAPGADYTELEKGAITRAAWGDVRTLLQSMLDLVNSSEIVHDNNAMKIAGQDYRYTRGQAKEGVAGFEAKYDEMKGLWDTSGTDDDADEADGDEE